MREVTLMLLSIVGAGLVLVGALVGTCFFSTQLWRGVMDSDLSKAQWMFPMRGRWLRTFLATALLVFGAPLLFVGILIGFGSVLYAVLNLVGVVFGLT